MPRLRRCGEGPGLLGRCLALVPRLPLLVGHAVDSSSALLLGERDSALVGRVLEPVRQAVPAEAGEVHEVNVLHVRAGAQMLDEVAEGGRFELGAGGRVEIGHGIGSVWATRAKRWTSREDESARIGASAAARRSAHLSASASVAIKSC